MTQQQFPPRRRHRRRGGVYWLIFTIALVITCVIGYMKLVPSFEQQEVVYSHDHPIYYNGELQQHGALVQDGHIKLPLPLLDELLEDSPIHYESETNTLVLTTLDKVLRFKTESLTALLNEKSYELNITAQVENDTVYIPAELIEQLYGLHIEQMDKVIALYDGQFTIDTGSIIRKNGTALRSEPTIKSAYYRELALGERLLVWETGEDWTKVQTESGTQGYVKSAHIQKGDAIVYSPSLEQYEGLKHDLSGKKINLTWEAIYNRQPTLSTMPSMEGLNVVSPTWFELVDAEGTIQGKATHEYMEWANKRGYQVWALFSNGFEPDWTTAVLASTEKRFAMIQQLVAFAELYQLDGINIDFENVYTEDKENLVQFVKEMMPIMHEQGLVVSIDVTPKSNSEMWSVFLDRAALGKLVDYMMVMAYDEHWASSPKAGSVASLPWVEQSIKRILEEDQVAPEKLILGMPLYTRVWSEETLEDGSTKVSSKAIGMTKAQEIITEHQLTPELDEASGQHYIEYVEDGIKQRIWLEDERSIAGRIDLVHKYKLAGVATWARTFAKDDIWKVIDEELNQ
ncbi:glycosyl hydrolase family 18 protein [Paenibacillus sp. FSL W7-1287]|uniref:glycosyl hydrolase family 18 protein n=1 Tax=Paenibacillus sp. FSL W7-1287 TaxID=2954538 RepID=UPI0030F96707